MKSFRAWWDPVKHEWKVKESGETSVHSMTEGMFEKYRDGFQTRSDWSFWQRLKMLYWELDHTRYKWIEGIGIVGIVAVEMVSPKTSMLTRLWRRLSLRPH